MKKIYQMIVVVELLMALALVGPASASSFGFSPEPTLATISGIDEGLWEIGHPSFGAGTYRIVLLDGYTDWQLDDMVETSTGVVIGENSWQLFTSDSSWLLKVYTPELHGFPSSGVQWAWTQLTPTLWAFGIEDMRLPGGDGDYNDKWGFVNYIGPECFGCTPDDQGGGSPVPEPSTLVLLGMGLVSVAHTMRRKAGGR